MLRRYRILWNKTKKLLSADMVTRMENFRVQMNGNSNKSLYPEQNPQTRLLSLSSEGDNSDIIEEVVGILHRGGIVALPTDTLYGVACLAQCTEAVEKLYELKSRNVLKPVAICVGESYDVCQWARFPQSLAETISKKLGIVKPDSPYRRSSSPVGLHDFLDDILPGPITIVTERSPALNNNLNPKTSLVGIRVPDHQFIRDLADRLREPLALTSANVSGDESSLFVKDFESLWPKLDAVIDAGEVGTNYMHGSLKYTREGSTVFRVMPDGCSFKVLRAGCAYEQTVEKLKKWNLKLVI